jgi:peroxiredoxin
MENIVQRVLVLSIAAVAALAVERSSGPVIGQLAPDFATTDTHGAPQRLWAYRGKWVVLEWFSSQCPYTLKHYNTGNMQRLQRTYTEKGVVWLSIVSSAPGREGYTTAAKANDLTRQWAAAPTAVVRDTAGTIGHLYDARNTPQMFVINPAGTLVYAGAIDDKRTSDTTDVRIAHNYVAAALDAALAGKNVTVQLTQPYGCTVQYADR